MTPRLGQVTDESALFTCDDCGDYVWHVVILAGDGERTLRPVPHEAHCGRPCAKSDHLHRAMIDLHFAGCGQCAALGKSTVAR